MPDGPPEERFRKFFQLLRPPGADQMSLGEIASMAVLAESRCDEMLAQREQAWRQLGQSKIIADAILICDFFGQALPPWLANAAIEAIEKRKSFREGRRRDDLLTHVVRWSVVKELRDRRSELLASGDDRGSTWERCYAAASTALANTKASGGEDTIKASYQKVQRRVKAGDDAQLRIWIETIQTPGLSILDRANLIVGKRRKRRARRRK